MKNKFIQLERLTILLLLAFISISGAIAQQSIVGWASYNGGTTGGFGGETVIITSRSQFLQHVKGEEPKILFIKDTLNLVLYERVKVYSNKTIFGLTDHAMIRFGGLEVVGNNVIIQNLVIGDFYDGDWSGKTHSTDALTLYGQNIWIDHCWLYAGADGLLDIRSGNGNIANYITVSYTRFNNHNKVSLIGSSDSSIEDRDHFKVTFHHCWFDGTLDRSLNQRLPRVRFGDVHLFNNYYEEISSYCIAARIESDLYVESNYFRNSKSPHLVEDFGVGLEDPDLVALDNIYELCSGDKSTNGSAFNPSSFYDYEPDPVHLVPYLVINEAGPFNSVNNLDPVAINDTIDYSGMSGALTISVTDNDYDIDGGDLRLTHLANEPDGIFFIKNNNIIYAPPSNSTGVDTLEYVVVDTQGGEDTGMVLIFYDGLNTLKDNSMSFNQIQLFPNPAGNYVNIDLNEFPSALNSLSIIDNSGKLLVSNKLIDGIDSEYFELFLGDIPAGTYRLILYFDQGFVSKSLVVNK